MLAGGKEKLVCLPCLVLLLCLLSCVFIFASIYRNVSFILTDFPLFFFFFLSLMVSYVPNPLSSLLLSLSFAFSLFCFLSRLHRATAALPRVQVIDFSLALDCNGSRRYE